MPLRDTLAMTRCTRWLRSFMSFACMLFTFLGDAGRFLPLCLRPSSALAAENLFRRKQLALYQERHIKPRRTTQATRIALDGALAASDQFLQHNHIERLKLEVEQVLPFHGRIVPLAEPAK